MFKRCGCAYQAVVVAEAVMKKNFNKLYALRSGDQALFLRAQHTL